MTKFTAADVVVGATVHIRTTSTFGPKVTTSETHGEVKEVDKREVRVDGGGRSVWVDVQVSSDYTVEILDVQPPKPEYVVGGIYRTGNGGLQVRRSGGWAELSLGSQTYTDAEYERWGLTIGGRVLVIDYPNDDELTAIRREHESSFDTAPTLIVAALDAEARS